MEGASSRLRRDASRVLRDDDEVGGRGASGFPYERDGLKYAQAVISQTPEGKWKFFVCSDQQVEMSMVGELEDVIRELRHAATREWHKRSQY